MTDDNARNQIALLEDRIETLTDSISRCAKIAFAAKILVIAGLAWFALMLLSLVSFDPTMFAAAISAILGGIVLSGSNATTQAQTEAERQAAEAMRAELIGQLSLTVVGNSMRTLH
jgi:hypothetical protein